MRVYFINWEESYVKIYNGYKWKSFEQFFAGPKGATSEQTSLGHYNFGLLLDIHNSGWYSWEPFGDLLRVQEQETEKRRWVLRAEMIGLRM